MTQPPRVPTELLKAVDATLQLLNEHSVTHAPLPVTSEPLPSLLEQCQDFCAQIAMQQAEPIRTIHHFACSGGTIISKQLAAMPNTRVLSEVDPFSSLSKVRFTPSDLISLLRNSSRNVNNDLLQRVFLAGLDEVYKYACQTGERLVLRDHSHSHFCTNADISTRPLLLDVIQAHYPTRSVLTLRHPLDSYLSLQANSWLHFAPGTLEEYSRRYLLFLDSFPNVPIFKYEDFTQSPALIMEKMCNVLALPYNPYFEDVSSVQYLSGDSGRAGNRISLRARRAIPEAVAQECLNSQNYHKLCTRLEYET